MSTSLKNMSTTFSNTNVEIFSGAGAGAELELPHAKEENIITRPKTENPTFRTLTISVLPVSTVTINSLLMLSVVRGLNDRVTSSPSPAARRNNGVCPGDCLPQVSVK